MARKSKTQRAKASATRAAKKTQDISAEAQSNVVAEASDAKPKKRFFSKDKVEKAASTDAKAVVVEEKKADKPKKKRFQFLYDVRAELRRVTWPTKKDIFRWSIVVVTALVFFGVYVFFLDNLIVTPLLLAISGLGA